MCVGDVAMCVGDLVKLFIFLCFFEHRGRSSVLKQHRIVTILQIVCLKMLKDKKKFNERPFCIIKCLNTCFR